MSAAPSEPAGTFFDLDESPLSRARRQGRPATPEYAPISETLRHVGSELRGLCAAAYDLEKAVGALISAPGAPGGLGTDGLRGLQELDRLIQHIDGLADYLQALSRATEHLGEIDVSAARRLVKVARLADGLMGVAHRPPIVDDGDGVEFL